MTRALRVRRLPLALTAGGACLAVALGAGSLTGSPLAAGATAHQRAAAMAARQRAAARALSSGDSPAGFWYGTDSSYIGMIGNWAAWKKCGGEVVWSVTDSNNARTDFLQYRDGIGVGGYWFMAGPGVDPHYNGTASEAYAWGEAQAAHVIYDLPRQATPVNYPVVFMDIELPGYSPSYTPAPDNGWNSVYTSTCSGRVKQDYVPASLDRADLNGFASYLTSHSSYKAGVYSAPSIWSLIFGTSTTYSSIPNTYEWTYTDDTSSLSHHPDGWCLAGTSTCAQFFGGQTSSAKYALMWQWSGGGGTRNGYGDFDQIDASRTP